MAQVKDSFDPWIPQTPPMPLSTMDQTFKKIAQKAARAYRMLMAPCASIPESERRAREYEYLPIDVVTEEKFEPHGWVITAMYRAMEIGSCEEKERGDLQIKQIQADCELRMQALRNQLERYETIDRIRRYLDDANCRSTEDIMQLVYKLSDIR